MPGTINRVLSPKFKRILFVVISIIIRLYFHCLYFSCRYTFCTIQHHIYRFFDNITIFFEFLNCVKFHKICKLFFWSSDLIICSRLPGRICEAKVTWLLMANFLPYHFFTVYWYFFKKSTISFPISVIITEIPVLTTSFDYVESKQKIEFNWLDKCKRDFRIDLDGIEYR